MANKFFRVSKLWALLAAGVFPLATGPWLPAAPARQTPLPRIERRLLLLKNFTARYVLVLEYAKNPVIRAFNAKVEARMVRMGFQGTFSSGPDRMWYAYHLRYLNGHLRVTRTVPASDMKKDFPANEKGAVIESPLIRVWLPTRRESLVHTQLSRTPFGTIKAPRFPQSPLIWALGLAAPASRHWLSAKGLAGMRLSRDGAHKWFLEARSVVAPPGTRPVTVVGRWTIATVPDIRITGFVQRVGRQLITRVSCSRFHKIGNLDLPTKVVVEHYLGNLGLAGKDVLTDISYRISPATNSLSRYPIKFPVGASVQDMRIAHAFVITGHPSYLTDHEIFLRLKH
jgi:hypothetical protein